MLYSLLAKLVFMLEGTQQLILLLISFRNYTKPYKA